MTPPVLDGRVRRSARRKAMPPIRFNDSPESVNTHSKKRKTTPDIKSQRNREDIKEDCTSDGDGGLSAYELERLENIRQNQAFLSSMNIIQAMEELKQFTSPKPSQRGLMRSHAAVKEVLPARKSLRLLNIKAETLTLPPEPSGKLTYTPYLSLKHPAGPQPMNPVNMEQGSKLPSQLLELCSEDLTTERKMDLKLKEYCSALKIMRITEETVAKVVKERVFSAAFHPCTSSLLMATGDMGGHLGLWKLGGDWGDDGVLLFRPHTRPVSCLAFSRAQPTHLLSLSYDGSLRCMDVEKAVFDEVFIEDDLRTFDFLSHDCSTLLVGNRNGEVAIVDRRTPGNSHESLHSLDPKTLRCVSVHPLQKQYFAVAENSSMSILISFDRIYDTSAMTAESPLLTSIRHNMRTGRWLSKLSAVWDPKQEDCFVVGSLSNPRRVEVFHESGKPLHCFKDDENLKTVQSVTAFHPTRNALLGGNSSGRLHVFTD
ncbi:WD repeat-containing protein 76 isoform X3 [Gymnodraco acuticeps]|uniref:WD repeat-containing protein 76 n=1 Tax=Gymnodraco acuticeps TaxID=8218 RepID=A0A6P8SYF0_GYMAC|nr:WD repeat-containing protein 76 isoform X3 [Gymnodraco acuticeps]